MGERLPKSYLVISDFIQKLQKEKDVPVVSIEEFFREFPDEQLVRRALNLLTLFGKCAYFEQPKELSNMVILDPRFLARDVMAQLFNPQMISYYKDGVVKHADLQFVWSTWKQRADFPELAEMLMNLMQKFGVSFRLVEDQNKPFMEQRSIIPTLLPKKEIHEGDDGRWQLDAGSLGMMVNNTFPGNYANLGLFSSANSANSSASMSNLGNNLTGANSLAGFNFLLQEEMRKQRDLKVLWPLDPPHNRKVQAERILKFNTIPAELVRIKLINKIKLKKYKIKIFKIFF